MAGHFLLSPGARNCNLRTVDAMTENDAYATFLRLRWNYGGKQRCPACGKVDHHYQVSGRRQFRCKVKGCGKSFSATSGTKFADRKLTFKALLRGIVIFVTNSKGLSAIAFSNLMGVAYATGFTMQHKLRESLWSTRDLTPLQGLIHIDGAHFCGRPRKTDRGRGKKKMKASQRLRISDVASAYHRNRRIVIVLRELYTRNDEGGKPHPVKGMGARRTIVEFTKGESAENVMALAHRYIQPGSTVMTDELASYNEYGRLFDHLTVDHDKEFSTPDGVNNNQAESFWARMKRMVRGQMHRITPHYLAEYANETAWREDTRTMTQRDRVEILLKKALCSGRSRWWRGYWQGTHRAGDLQFVP